MIFDLHNTTELVVFGAGSLGLLVALVSVVRRKRSRGAPSASSPDPAAGRPIPPLDGGGMASPKTDGWWGALAKTRDRFLKRHSPDVQALRDTLEEACIVSDLGVTNTQEALAALDLKALEELAPEKRDDFAREKLAQHVRPWLDGVNGSSVSAEAGAWPASRRASDNEPSVIWFVGVNGVGKTTSIAKLSQELLKRGHSVLLGAGDTFRAAAGEQLETWAQRLGIDCIRGQAGADSSAVLFDAIQAGKARGVDFVLCDSAGRLHNQNQLMEALQKNKRVMQKALPSAPHEVLLVLDANTGQNMLQQASQFQEAVGVSGLILTKLDGTARGGAVVAVARKTGLPLRRLGLGEKAEDFVPFNAGAFTEALFGLRPGSVPY